MCKIGKKYAWHQVRGERGENGGTGHVLTLPPAVLENAALALIDRTHAHCVKARQPRAPERCERSFEHPGVDFIQPFRPKLMNFMTLNYLRIQYYCPKYQDPILRLLNLQEQRQRCSRLERFLKVEKNIFCFQNELGYPWRCKNFQRWRCKSKS
jgi:hypothetical protein